MFGPISGARQRRSAPLPARAPVADPTPGLGVASWGRRRDASCHLRRQSPAALDALLAEILPSFDNLAQQAAQEIDQIRRQLASTALQHARDPFPNSTAAMRSAAADAVAAGLWAQDDLDTTEPEICLNLPSLLVLSALGHHVQGRSATAQDLELVADAACQKRLEELAERLLAVTPAPGWPAWESALRARLLSPHEGPPLLPEVPTAPEFTDLERAALLAELLAALQEVSDGLRSLGSSRFCERRRDWSRALAQALGPVDAHDDGIIADSGSFEDGGSIAGMESADGHSDDEAS